MIWRVSVGILSLLLGSTAVKATILYPPAIPENAGVVGAIIQAPSAQPAHAITFGQPFVCGAVPAGVSATIDGAGVPTQIDVKTRCADGSAKYGVITILAPALAAGNHAVVLSAVISNTASQLSLISPTGYAFSVTIAVSGGRTYTIDVPTILASGNISYWRQGAVATEGRVEAQVTGALRLVFDVARYADGSYSTDVNFANDAAMTASGGTLTYMATVNQNGSVAYQSPSLTHFQYQQWHRVFWTNGPSGVNVQHDLAYLEKTKAIPNFSLTTGVDSSAVTSAAALMAIGDWTAPFGSLNVVGCYPGYNCVTGDMSITGGRPDIGLMTGANGNWLLTQDATIAKLALAQADTAANVPWHYWDTCHSAWLNADNYPQLWVDPRGGVGTACDATSTGLTQQTAQGPLDGCCTVANGWNAEAAHMPDLSFIPYLLTGSRYYLDQLNAQASYAIMDKNAANWSRNGSQGIVLSANEVRDSAWSLREADEAAWANPDGSPEAVYFGKIAANNFSWMNTNLATWSTAQGTPHGTIPGPYGNNDGTMPPWQQDYVVSVVAEAARLGISGALPVLQWEDNWSSGRFLASGANPRDGIAYNVKIGPSSTAYYTTWSAFEAATAAAGLSNGTGFATSDGDYGALALESLAETYNQTGSANALSAYNWLAAAGAPQTAVTDFQTSMSYYNVVPATALVLPPPPVLAAGSPVYTKVASSVWARAGRGQILCTQLANKNGTILVGPTIFNKITYWYIGFITGCSGWVSSSSLGVN